MWLGIVFFTFLILYSFTAFIKSDIFEPLLLQIFFLSLFSLFEDSNYMHDRKLKVVIQFTNAAFTFSIWFCLFYIFGSFYCYPQIH
jgi:hypothetical protein